MNFLSQTTGTNKMWSFILRLVNWNRLILELNWIVWTTNPELNFCYLYFPLYEQLFYFLSQQIMLLCESLYCSLSRYCTSIYFCGDFKLQLNKYTWASHCPLTKSIWLYLRGYVLPVPLSHKKNVWKCDFAL